MADVTSDIVLFLPADGYQSAQLSTISTFVFANGTFNYPVVSTNIPVLIPTIRDTVPGAATTTYYYMRGKDVDCGSLTYRFWVVTGAADATGALYVGSKCGASPFSDIVVEHTWTV